MKTPRAKRVDREARSRCPIHAALQIFGDRWSLLIIRDILFDNRRTFGELFENSPEHIASNILTARLKRLESAG
jgi:DNA-binding HxlR family transcriptional regulator